MKYEVWARSLLAVKYMERSVEVNTDKQAVAYCTAKTILTSN
jgi:hypothetical protein